jgi:probable rRNA maturation factor
VSVQGVEERDDLPIDGAALAAAVRAAVVGDDRLRTGEISLTLVDDEAMAVLNRRWLGREGPTDVIAFDLGEGTELVGDVYIAPETARRNAAIFGVPLDEELLRLAIHGTLHVLGHDHPEGEGREDSPMFRLQEQLLRGLHSG